MLRHIVMWNFNDGFSDEENAQNACKIKSCLEGLANLLEGVKELCVHIDALATSNRDIVLNSLFESEEALAAYQAHPEHKRVGELIRSVMKDRVCIDYYE